MAGLVSSETVEPGETGNIEVTIDPIGKKGPFTKKVLVVSNDRARPRQVLSIIGNVKHKVVARRGLRMEKVLFAGRCARCHAAPAGDKMGQELFQAVCASCHGAGGKGGSGGPIRLRDRAGLRRWTTDGKAGTAMPGYSEAHGGPLDDRQIDSLVDYMMSLPKTGASN